MHYHDSEGIKLNGNWYGRQELLTHSAAYFGFKDELLVKTLSFLKEWFGNNDFVKLKTSGSTGTPKSISLPKKNMVSSAVMTGKYFSLKPGMTAHLCLSPEFVAAKMMIVRAVVLQLDMVTTDIGANPLGNYNLPLDFSAMVPLQVSKTIKSNPEKLDLINTLIVGGGGVSPVLEESLQSRKVKCWSTYGMTETLSHIALRPINGPGRSSWFTPLPGVELSVDQRGCLVIDAPHLNPEKVITNDLVILENKRFQVLGRIDEVINTAGHKIIPRALEDKIAHLLDIPFFIAGEHHEEAGQVPVLFLEGTISDGQILHLQNKLAENLLSFEKPRKIRLLSSFLYLESGKIDRNGTIRQYKNLAQD